MKSARYSSARCSAPSAWTTRTFASGFSTTGAAPGSQSCAAEFELQLSHPRRTTPTPRPATSTTRCAHCLGAARPPDFISILDADFVPTPQFLYAGAHPVSRRRRRHRADASAFHQSRSASRPISRRRRRLARRAALFLRRADAGEGRLGHGVLLRHLFGHPDGGAGQGRRLPDRIRDRGLSADLPAEAARLPDRLSQRAAFARTRARRASRNTSPSAAAGALASCRSCRGADGPFKFGNGLHAPRPLEPFRDPSSIGRPPICSALPGCSSRSSICCSTSTR